MDYSCNLSESSIINIPNLKSSFSGGRFTDQSQFSHYQTMENCRKSLPITFHPNTKRKGYCSICNKSGQLFLFSCEKHTFCWLCIDSSDFIRNLLKVAKSCKLCKSLTESLTENMTNPDFFLQVSKINLESLKSEIKPKTQENPEKRKKKFLLNKLAFWRTKCQTCNQKPKIIVKICTNHAICEPCYRFFLSKKQLPKGKIDCKTCDNYFHQSIYEPNCARFESAINQCGIQGFPSKFNEDSEFQTSTEYQVCQSFQGIGQNFKLESEELRCVNKESFLGNFHKLESYCSKCGGDYKTFGFMCNHNICINCLSHYAFLEILQYERNYANGKTAQNQDFAYHCPFCTDVIDIPTRIVFKYVEKGLLSNYLVSENYFYTVLWPKIPFYDGITK